MSQRRDLLRFIATLGAAGASGYLREVLAAGDLPPGLHRLEGTATVNGKPAKSGAAVSLGDRIATGPDSHAVVVQKGDAFLMRADTVIEGPQMAPKTVKTSHHEQPLLLTTTTPAMAAQPGPFRNHTDDELIMLESLVGRVPPFMKDGQYPAKKY